jgi:hypothetical protein
MPIHETDGGAGRPGLGEAAKKVAEHASSLARLELELAAAEIGRKVKALAIGIGLGLGAVLFLLFALGFALATAAAAIALVVSTWVALLIVTGGTLLLALLLAGFAVGLFKKGTPPVPKQAIEEAKLTTEAIKSDER